MLLHWRNAMVKTSFRQLPWQQKSKSGGRSGRALFQSPRACRTLLEARCLWCFQISTVCCTYYCWSQSQVLGWRGQILQWNWSGQCCNRQCSRTDWMDSFSCTSTKTFAWIIMGIIDKYSTKHPRGVLFIEPSVNVLRITDLQYCQCAQDVHEQTGSLTHLRYMHCITNRHKAPVHVA